MVHQFLKMSTKAGEPVRRRQPQQQKTGKSTRPVGMQCSEPGVASLASDVAECISIALVERLLLTTVT